MTALVKAIKKVATGPHLSKDLTTEEAQQAMEEVLSGEADPVQAAIFLIALRIKRETNEENLGIYRAIQANTEQCIANVEQILLISDPFNGFNRYCPVSAFLPAVLAASGLPTISQGVREMGPKFGVTHSQVLGQAGIDVEQSVSQSAEQVEQIGWAYVDHSIANAKLYALKDLRNRMIKRPNLATLEKMLMPVKAKAKTHLQIGFVHKAYSAILVWMSHHIGFNSAILIREVEGGVLPNLREPTNCFQSFTELAQPSTIDPAEFGISQQTRGVLPLSQSVTASETLQRGLEALEGKQATVFDSLVYGAAIALWHCGITTSQQSAAEYVRKIILTGKPKAIFESAHT